MSDWIDDVAWNDQGLVVAIVQDASSHELLMQAWMNQEALHQTVSTQLATYWSRSRQSIWRKGETSGHIQKVKEIRLDCDGDTILLLVEQVGGMACHTGRRRCFYRKLDNGEWVVEEPVLKDPQKIYGK